MPTNINKPTQICEQVLRETKQQYQSASILPSSIVVIDRLLTRRLELQRAYAEIERKLRDDHRAMTAFFEALLSVAASWNPQAIAKKRAARSKLARVNSKIARLSSELADLLERRSAIHNTSGFRSETHYHVCDVIEQAAAENHIFVSYVKKKLALLSGQYDLRYWPTLADFMRELAADANAAPPVASDTLTAAATAAVRASLGDFLKALLVNLGEIRARHYELLPVDFSLTDATLASLTNCALDLPAGECIEGGYVKRFRQRAREADADGHSAPPEYRSPYRG